MKSIRSALILVAVLVLASTADIAVAQTNGAPLPPHPRLLLNANGIADLKKRIASATWAKASWSDLATNAAKNLAKPVELPPRGGNWGHNYVCPIHGARLEQGKQIAPWQWEHICPVGDHVLTGDPSKGTLDFDGNAMMNIHLRYAGQVVDDGLVYQVTGDARYAQKAREILLAYADKYQSYPVHDNQGRPGGKGGHVASQSLTESSWLVDVLNGADLVWDTLSEPDRRAIEEKIIRPALNEIIIPQKYGIHNIQCHEDTAIGLAGLLLGDQKLISLAIDDPQYGVRQELARGVNADGLWLEGSSGYHFYTIDGLWPLLEAARNCGMDLYSPEFKKMFDGPIASALPNLALPNFNDSGISQLRERAVAYELAFARFHDPKYASLFGKRDNRMALLFGDLNLPAAASVGQNDSRNLAAGGYAILEQGGGADATWISTKYGPHGGGHGHPDKNTFILYSQGQIVSPDAGTHAYGSPLHADWDKTTLAHNTLVVDGQSQNPAQGKCIAFGKAQGVDYSITDAGAIYTNLNLTFIRTVAMMSPTVIVFIDQVRSDKEHTYDLAYHQIGAWDALPAGTAWSPPNDPGYKYLTKATVRKNDSTLTLKTRMTNGWSGAISLVSIKPTEIITGYGILKTTEDLVPLLIQRRKSDHTTYLWAVSLDGNPVKLSIANIRGPNGKMLSRSDAALVEVDMGPTHRTLLINPEKKKVAAKLAGGENWESEDAFAVR